MRIFFLIIIAGLLVGGLSQCRTTKKIQTVITPKKDSTQTVPVEDTRADSIRFMKDIFDSIKKNKIDFQTFSAKIKVDFEDKQGKKNDFTAFIRLKKDSILWISVNALLGIEAFRVIITPDSVKVLNKLDKIIQLRSVEYLQDVTHVPFTFSELQNIIIGNPVYLDSNIVAYKKEEKEITLISIGKVFKHLLTINKDDFILQNSKLDDLDNSRSRTCLIIYGDFERRNNMIFSSFRKITVSEKERLDIEMRYKQYSFNEDLNFPFNIPKNYKQK
ncbi:MAG: DUF4292 domain-containing protein [Chitinophagaceae bacterium]